MTTRSSAIASTSWVRWEESWTGPPLSAWSRRTPLTQWIPAGSSRDQPVRRLVEDEGGRIPEQRGGDAQALLADPRILLFDEPINGLDLDGVRWIRGLLRQLADDGRTVLVSSHLMSEVQQTADRLLVVGRGRLLADSTTDELLRGAGTSLVKVRSPQADALATQLNRRGLGVHRVEPDVLTVEDATAADIGDLARHLDVTIHHLSEVEQSLEDAYLHLTRDSLEHHGDAEDPIRTLTAAGGASC